ncbi:MAG: arylsulfatase [Bryobacteraceae bacterium]|nr:arylsulfatase [Bryobacteraceae bacterium]MDW8380220.1 arylsulfatase [Bryobacterales bacterium]
MMNRRQFLHSWATAALPSLAAKPNLIVILADDMGYCDLGCYGSEIRTPNLDRLASHGVRFTQFYNTARCCPTRASLLTGLYPHQAGVGHMVDNSRPFPGYRGDLAPHTVTIAEALKPAGYRTYMVGKWHVTPVTPSKHNWPRQRGFDRFYGTIHGAGSFYDPVTLTLDSQPAEPASPDYFYTDALAHYASKFIQETPPHQPFFLYAAFTAPHWPLHALEPDIERYRGRYKEGWDVLRRERHERMIQMGIVDKSWRLTPRDPRVPAWKEAPQRKWQERRMEVYAAMIDRLDQCIGRIVDTLVRQNQLDNTLILFLSDNGGCAEELGPHMVARHVPKQTREGRPVLPGNRPDLMPGGPHTYQSYGQGWANVSNTPFRLYKHWVHEGGIATPFIVHWPARIKNPGSLNHDPGHVIDILPTCLEAAVASYPKERQGRSTPPVEGKSLVPCFEGRKRASYPALYWEHEGNRAVREGDWKLVSRYPDQWELFHMRADRTETNDLAKQEPERVERMAAHYQAWASRAQVVAWEEVLKSPRLALPEG